MLPGSLRLARAYSKYDFCSVILYVVRVVLMYDNKIYIQVNFNLSNHE